MLELERKAFYSPTELARIFEVDPSTVLDWIHAGSLYAVKLGPKTYRVPLAVVLGRVDPEATKPARLQLDARAELRADERKRARRPATAR